MKRVIKASSNAELVRDLVEFLGYESVDEHDILMHFFSYLPASESVEVLKDYIKMSDLEEEWEEYKEQ